VPKPTEVPTWATDAGAISDPGPMRRATGFIAGKKLPAKWLNWLLNRQAGWFTYLRDLHNEPEFLNKPYNWSGLHRFTGDAHSRDHYWTPSRMRKVMLSPMSGTRIGAQLPSWFVIGGIEDLTKPEGTRPVDAVMTFTAHTIWRVPFTLPAAVRLHEVRAGYYAGGAGAQFGLYVNTLHPLGDPMTNVPTPMHAVTGRIAPSPNAIQPGNTSGGILTWTTYPLDHLPTYGGGYTTFFLDFVASDMSGVTADNANNAFKSDTIYWIELTVEEFGPHRF
jgi:hypothetical protein